MKNPTEELTGHILFTLVVGYFAALNMTDFLLSLRAKRSRLDSPSPFRRAYARHLPRFIGGVYSREGGGLRSIFSVLFQGDCRGTSCLAMTTSRAMFGGIFRCAQYDVKSPIGTSCHFAYALYDALKNAPTAILQSARKLFNLIKIT